MRLAVFGLIGGIVVIALGMTPAPEAAKEGPAEADRVAVATASATSQSGSPVPKETSSTDSTSVNKAETAVQEGTSPATGSRQNLTTKVEMLRRSLVYLDSIPGYTANLSKQEEVKGELLDEQTLFIKCRQKPFSVYLRWSTGDEGREVLYIEGANNGKLLGHDGGWKARIPAFYLQPDCPLAMRDTRYPASCAGIRFLIDQMLGVHKGDLKASNFASCEMETDVPFDDRPCVKFTTKYQSSKASPLYRKSVTFLDRERSIPLHSEHYGWPAKETASNDDTCDAKTLLERYTFRDFASHESLSDADFDRSNKEYKFR